MTEEQKPARAYQPWSDQEYGVLDGCRAGGVSVDTLAKGLSRYPSEVENALIKLKGLNEAMTNRAQAQTHVNAVHKPKTSILSMEDLAGVDRQIHDYILRKARRLIINGKNYDSLLEKARKRVHLQIEISATLAGGK